MAEMAHAGEDHSKARFVGGGDNFVIAHRATGLDDGGDTGLGSGDQTIREGEEGVRGGDATACHGFSQPGFTGGIFGLAGGDTSRVNAAHLTRSNANCGPVLGIDDGVGFNVLGDCEGEA